MKKLENGLIDPFPQLAAKYGEVEYHPVINLQNARILHALTAGCSTIEDICSWLSDYPRFDIQRQIDELIDATYVNKIRAIVLGQITSRYFISEYGRHQFVRFLAAIDEIMEPYLQRVR